ncbi:MAG: hypothetical protein ABSE58_04055 [Candidatus Limnocylindrales bacterium]|jgi:hypothetical protein
MPRFYFQETAALPFGPADCVEAARRTLTEMGSTPTISGYELNAKLGSQLKMRIVGGAWCPVKWLPIEIAVRVLDYGHGRQVVVNVAERMGFGIMFWMEDRYRSHCQNTAVFVRNTIAGRLAYGL